MRRHWYVIFGASLLLHLVVFWPTPREHFRGDKPAPLLVNFVEAQTVGAVPSTAVQVAAGNGAAQLGESVVEDRPQKPVAIVGRTKPGSMRGHKNQHRSAGEGRDSAQEMSSLAAVSSATGLSPLVSDDADEAGRMSRYRVALAAAAVRLQKVAGASGTTGLQGRSVVIVRLRPGVALPEVHLSESSGQPALDEGALGLIRRAASDLPVPARTREFSLALPVLFEAM